MRKFGLIGKSLGHSFSSAFFSAYFRENGIDAEYQNVELAKINQFDEVKNDFSGFNVTIPYKEEIIPLLDGISQEAKEIGAVNVVKNIEGKFYGFNSDAFGFHQSIKPFLTNQHERAIIFGTGGASKAIEYVLTKLGIEVIFISRNPKGENQFSYSEVNNYMLSACKLLVNCTPVGTFPKTDDCLNIPFEHLSEHHLAIDLIYNPKKTLFLTKAEKNGATILNGASMLKEQALKSWEIWNHLTNFEK